MELFKISADEGDSEALNYLGLIYENAYENEDREKSIQYFQKAHNKGNNDATLNIAILQSQNMSNFK